MGTFGVLAGLLALLVASFTAGVLSVHGGSGAGIIGGVFAIVSAVTGLLNLIIGPFEVLVGWGLWKLKDRARIGTFVFAGIEILGSLFGLAGGWGHLGAFAILGYFAKIQLACRVAIAGWVIWYLLQPNVIAAFDRGQTTTASA
jgi:hypothetical protein